MMANFINMNSSILFTLVYIAIISAINGLILWVATKIFKFKKQDAKTALIIALIIGLINFLIALVLTIIPVKTGIVIILFLAMNFAISVASWLLLVKYFYKEKWGITVAAAAMSLILGYIIGVIVNIVLMMALLGGALFF